MSDQVAAAELIAGGPVPTEQDSVNESTTAKTAEAAGGETDPQATANDGEEENEEHSDPKRKSGYRRARERADLYQRLYEQERQLNSGRKDEQPKPEEAKPQAADTAPWDDPKDPEPDIETFDGDLKQFFRAHREWDRRDLKRQEQHETKAEEAKSQQETIAKTWQARVITAKQKFSDYDTVAKDLIAVMNTHASPALDALVGRIAKSEFGPEIAYHLGQDHDEVIRLSRLAPEDAIEEFGILRARLAQEKSQQEEQKAAAKEETAAQPAPSRAPKPVTPVTKPSSAKAPSIYDPEMPFKQFVKEREAQIERKER